MKNKNVVEQIQDCVGWLDDNRNSVDIVKIAQCIDRLAVLSVSLGYEVSEAYALMNNLEDEYKIAYAKFVSTADLSAAKAEKVAEANLEQEKKNWTTAKNGYRKLHTFLERIDKVIESYRQYVSVTKLDLKNI